MLNRSKSEAEQFIRENSKAYIGKEGKTDKEIGLVLGVSGPRVNQMKKAMNMQEVIEQGPEAA
jgi:DNA-directed RNA polymerase specialized sigma subunit